MTDINEKRCANCSWHISGGKSGGEVGVNFAQSYRIARILKQL